MFFQCNAGVQQYIKCHEKVQSFVKKGEKNLIKKKKFKGYSSWQKLQTSVQVFCQLVKSFKFVKVIFSFFHKAFFSITLPHTLTKSFPDLVQTHSNVFFWEGAYNIPIFGVRNYFIVFKIVLKLGKSLSPLEHWNLPMHTLL